MRTRTRNLKRLLSLLLCLCLVTGLLPVTVLAADQPVITTETLEGATVGVYYETTLTATASAQNGTLTWKAQGLPNGLALSGSRETAALLGTPTEAGEFTFTVTVTETIPAESEEPAEEPAAEEGETPADAPQPTVLTDTKTYTLTVAKAVQDEPEPEPEPDGNTMEEPGTGDPLLPTDNTDGESLRTTTGTMSAEIYTGQESGTGAFTGKTSTFAAGDTVILHSFKFSPVLATDSTAHSIGILPTSETDPNKADVIWYEESSNGTISNKPENNVLQLIGFQLGSNVSPGTYRFVIWAGPDYLNETVYTSTETFTVTGGTGGGTVTASSYTASFATDEDFSNPVTSVAADGTPYYFKAEGFDPALAYTQDSAQYSYDVTVRTTTGIQILGLSKKTTVSNTNSVIQYVLKGPDAIDLAPGSYTLVMDIYSVSKSTGAREHIFTCTSTNQMVVTETSVGMPAITTNSPLPDGMTGQAYSQTLSANPGTPGNTITWSLASGRLPDGLTLDSGTGTISGTPTAAGNYTFTVTAKEADGGETSKSFTIAVTQAITSTGLTVTGGSYSPGDSISVYWNMSASLTSDATATLTLHYKDTSGTAKFPTYSMTRYSNYFYAYVALPDDCAGVQKVSAEAKVSGQTVTAENSALDITMKGRLSLIWTSLANSGTLTIQDSSGETVANRSLYDGSTGLELSLPAGTYTLSATAYVSGVGNQTLLGDTTVTVTGGGTTAQSLRFNTLEAVTYTPKVQLSNGDSTSSYSLNWYGDAAGEDLLATGKSYTALSTDTLYVKAVPTYSVSATHNGTAVVPASEELTLSLTAKPADTVTVKVSCEDVTDGTGTLDKVSGYVVLSQPRTDGYKKTTQKRVYNAGAVTFEGVTAGSTITFTPDQKYACGPVSTTIDSVTGGSKEISLNAGALEGVISSNITLQYPNRTTNLTFTTMSNLKVKKVDGTVIPHHRTSGNILVLDDLTELSDGTQLTISGQYGSGDFPIAVFEQTVTLSGEDLSATADIDMVARGTAKILARNQSRVAADLLLYRDDQLFYTKETFIASHASTYDYVYSSGWSPRLPEGSYTVYVVNRDYLNTVDPTTYQKKSTIQFEKGTFTSAPFTIRDNDTTSVTLNVPDVVQAYADVNFEMSSVTMSVDFPGTFTHTTVITLTGNEQLDETKDITLELYHNQLYNASALQSLTINGIPYMDFMDSMDGRVTLSFTGDELQRQYGGFPLRVSYVMSRYDYSSLSGRSYMGYTNDRGESRWVKVGAFYQETDDVTLNVPSMVNEKTFTVSGYVPQRGKDVTVYLDGAAVATVQSGRRADVSGKVISTTNGYFAAQVTLPEDAQEFDAFRVSAFCEGAMSEEAEVMYTETSGLLTEVRFYPGGIGNKDVYTVWKLGDSPSEGERYRASNYSSWLRWEMYFANADKVKNVVVHVPCSDGSEEEVPAVRMTASGRENTFQTTGVLIYGASPTGVYVTYETELVPRANAKEPISADDFAAGIAALNDSGVISGMKMTQGSMAGDQYALTFTLQNPDGKEDIPVTVESETTDWDSTTADELASFDALKQKPEYSTLPSYILYYDEGYLDIYDDDVEGGYWGSDRICKYSTADDGTIYQREIYTMSERIVITWDVEAQTTTTHRITLGAGGAQPDKEKVTSESEHVQAYQRTAQVEQLWMLFYQQLSDACEKAGTDDTGNTRMLAMSSRAAPKGGKLSLKVKIDVNKLKERAEALADDSETWAEGQEITAAEIRQIKDFLDDNPGLVDLYKMHQTAGGDNPYQVVGDIRATYYERGMGLIEKALSLTTGKPKDVVDTLKDGIKDYAIDTVKGKIFYRQSEGMVCDLYVAARQAERTETGLGGMLPNGINWSRFPTNIYDPNSSFSSGHNRQTLPNSPSYTYDPSGYVYEAVPSNRVVDATVNLYTFNESAQVEEWVDHELYNIEPNPQTTGADGRYEWFVPEGYWRVVVTKDGYETVDTGSSRNYGLKAQTVSNDPVSGRYWMPVLPVQLDVNIPLVSYEAPEVDDVEATTDGVYVTFSKYMQVNLSREGFKINGETPTSVAPVNAEASSSADGAEEYASIFLLTYPEGVNPAAGEEINVYVDNTVASYAGVKMEKTYAGENVTVAEQLPQTEEPKLASGSASGKVDQNTVVYLTVPDGASVYYTIDGSNPADEANQNRKLYNAVNGIIVDRTMTIKAVAVQAGKADSTPLILDYNVEQELPEPPDEPDEPVIPDDPGGSSGGGGGGGGGGSSSSNITTETTKNPDGSTTTTVTNKNTGTVTETTTWPDGSKEVIETKKDGTVTTTTTDTAGNQTAVVEKPDGSSQTTVSNKDGSGSVTLVDADGNIISQATLSESAVAAAQEKGEAVALPMPKVPLTTDRETAPTVTVDLPVGGSVKVEIPVEDVTTGTVAVLMKSNGDEEIIKTSVTTGNGVAVTLNDGDTVKIVDNSRDFADVPDNYWGAEAVDFAVSRELFAGTSATTFSPDTAMTRAMIVTVLARFEGVDTTTGDTWYEAGRQWAMENGVSDGTNMDASLTREQLATMLWRYAGSPSVSNDLSNYTDAGTVSSYAQQAMAWCVEQGIIGGTTTTTLSPQGPATRAQVATILMRFIEGTA